MIIVEKPSKPIEFTMTGAPRRPTTIVEYSQEIETLYAAVEKLAQLRTAMPASLEAGPIRDAIAGFVRGLMPHANVPDDGDIFAYGADRYVKNSAWPEPILTVLSSLVATAIRNYVIGILNKAGVSASVVRALPGHFVFDYPTIQSLSKLLYEILEKTGDIPTGDRNVHVAELPNLLASAGAGQTIVKIHDVPGDKPLIVIHGKLRIRNQGLITQNYPVSFRRLWRSRRVQ